ncbi:tetratricopeptide repeat protein, partial [Allosphingosinicella sp.]|uniref:tetratricopeptide repeat protein n=1 Tax=Allosphingosinicella sp. TaxID=2823234 RepID=UPI002EFD38AD
IKPRDNETFYREVDEELRRDQMRSYWDRYGKLAIAGVVLLLAAIGGFLWWQNQKQARAGEQGEALIGTVEALQSGNAQAAAGQVAQLEQSKIEGYRAAGLFSRANLMIESGNIAGAIGVLQGIASDEGLAEPYRHAALVRQTALEFDRLQPAQVIQRLQPLARGGEPWFGSAGELVAFAHLRQQRPDLAGPIFAAIAADETVPESIRSRAVQMAGVLGVDVQQSPAAGGAPTAPQAASPAAPATKE